jgi:hypothetical protein
MKGNTELCIHEAAHSVAALEHNIRFSTVSATTMTSHVALIPEEHNREFEVPIRAGHDRHAARRWVCVRHAANDRATGTWDVLGATTDYENAWKLLPFTGVSWGWLTRKTRLLVALHWPEIVRVANALAERGIMSSHDIQEVLDGKPRR